MLLLATRVVAILDGLQSMFFISVMLLLFFYFFGIIAVTIFGTNGETPFRLFRLSLLFFPLLLNFFPPIFSLNCVIFIR
jgi:hypothetical protein